MTDDRYTKLVDFACEEADEFLVEILSNTGERVDLVHDFSEWIDYYFPAKSIISPEAIKFYSKWIDEVLFPQKQPLNPD